MQHGGQRREDRLLEAVDLAFGRGPLGQAVQPGLQRGDLRKKNLKEASRRQWKAKGKASMVRSKDMQLAVKGRQ